MAVISNLWSGSLEGFIEMNNMIIPRYRYSINQVAGFRRGGKISAWIHGLPGSDTEWWQNTWHLSREGRMERAGSSPKSCRVLFELNGAWFLVYNARISVRNIWVPKSTIASKYWIQLINVRNESPRWQYWQYQKKCRKNPNVFKHSLYLSYKSPRRK